ncbi:ABC transporter permease [Leucobacter sp. CSA1]|uniref:Autoinducer 2 import system permease protein LsrD n=1 Tax=Leucobacter chromiisoli TaxID=2796471 RepID=A0A934Q7Q2_9MICO|nr:ABC transporter permease [Leucobacter chromiisoli]MBK0419805.1 ABC transporter permease [Leucobacter chromiisoli]
MVAEVASTAGPTTPPPETGAALRSRAPRFIGANWVLVLILAGLFLLCMIAIPQFRSWGLIAGMLNSQSLILLLALVATVVLRSGGFDLSISQTMVASAAITIVLSKAGVPLLVSVSAALGLGAVVGLINALLVVKVGVDSFVTTLGSYSALAGLCYFVTGSSIVSGAPQELVGVVRAPILGIPAATWFAWLLALILWYVYEKTPLGRYLLFIGGNPASARLAGIRVDRIRIGAYLVSGLLAALVGLVFLGWFGAVDPGVGSQFMLQPLAAAFLGTTAVVLGRFNALGTVIAVYLLVVGITGLQVLGAQTWVTNVFYGLALIIAVTAAKIADRRRRVR